MGDSVTTQYYIVKDYGFCLIRLTNFSGSKTTEQAVRDMADSFVGVRKDKLTQEQ
ncbi:MAG: hypothetical protein ACOX8M_06505 [Marvinbryantia sp.]|jgi:hypothetical protein